MSPDSLQLSTISHLDYCFLKTLDLTSLTLVLSHYSL